jgi:hypothetical protein
VLHEDSSFAVACRGRFATGTIAQGPIQVDEALPIAKQIAEALDAVG